jgi:CHAD domain-containing protein
MTLMPPPPLELLLPPTAGAEEIATAVRRRYGVEEDGTDTYERAYLDTHDARLRSAGLTLERSGDELRLRETGRPDRTAAAPDARRDTVQLADLPEGPLRARLAEVVENRAALPLAQVRSRRTHLRVLNGDEKTVVRMTIEAPEVHGERGNAQLDPRVAVRGVLGYDKAFERVRQALEDELGLVAVKAGLVDSAISAAGHDPRGVSTKVSVALERNMRADAALLSVCRRLAEVVEATLDGTIDDLDPEFLHDFRVAIRRTRSMLRELEGVLPPDDERRAAENLRWVQAITGPTRDLDVQLEEWDDLVAGFPAAAAADLAPLRTLLRRRRQEAMRQMRRELRGMRFEEAWQDWRALLDRPLPAEPDDDRPRASQPLGAIAGRRIRKVYARMLKLGGSIGDDSPAEDLHKLRKRAKELRYLLEIFGGLWPNEEVRPMVTTLKGLQDVLGRFQDREVQADFLRSLGSEVAAGPGGPDALIALGLVIDRLAADQASARHDFHARFDAFAAKKQRRRVDKVFAS